MMIGQHAYLNHSRSGPARVSGAPSIMAPVVPPNAIMDAEKQHEMIMKTAFSKCIFYTCILLVYSFP